MSENCNDCLQISTLKDDIKDIKAKVEKLENEVNIVKFDSGINKEQTKMVFNILKEIKESIVKISNKMDTIEAKPNVLLEKVAVGVMTAVVMLVISLALRYKGVM